MLMLSQVQLAEMTSLARSTIYYLENNKMYPDQNTALTLKKLFCEKGIVCDYINGKLTISIGAAAALWKNRKVSRVGGLEKAYAQIIEQMYDDNNE